VGEVWGLWRGGGRRVGGGMWGGKGGAGGGGVWGGEGLGGGGGGSEGKVGGVEEEGERGEWMEGGRKWLANQYEECSNVWAGYLK